jgi:rubredoxin
MITCFARGGMMPVAALRFLAEVALGELCARGIVCSAPVAGLGAGRTWLRPSIFADLLQGITSPFPADLFVGDTTQPYLPVPATRLRVLARAGEDQWELALLRPDDTVQALPGCLRTTQAGEALRRIAPLLPEGGAASEPELGALVERVDDLLRSAPEEAPRGMHRFVTPPDTLCLQEPSDGWDAGFIQDLCLQCQATGAATVGLSPARALFISGLDGTARTAVEECFFLRRYDPCGNPWRQWMLVEAGQEAAADVLATRLHTLCPVNPGYSISVQSAASPVGAVHFCLRSSARRLFEPRVRHGLLFREEGTPAVSPPKIAAEGLGITQAAGILIDTITKGLRREAMASPVIAPAAPPSAMPAHRCKECQTAYEESYGDPMGGVPAGTAFDALPESWECPVCAAPWGHFHREPGLAEGIVVPG